MGGVDGVAREDRRQSSHPALHLRVGDETGQAKTMGADEDVGDRVHRGPGGLCDFGHENKKDHINLLLHYLEHFFSYVYVQMNVGEDAKHFGL